MLQISVHRNDGIAPGMFHAAGYGQLMAEITGQYQGAHTVILPGQTAEYKRCCIAGAVVDKDDFILIVRRLHRPGHFFIKLLNIQMFIINGNDYRNRLFFPVLPKTHFILYHPRKITVKTRSRAVFRRTRDFVLNYIIIPLYIYRRYSRYAFDIHMFLPDSRTPYIIIFGPYNYQGGVL